MELAREGLSVMRWAAWTHSSGDDWSWKLRHKVTRRDQGAYGVDALNTVLTSRCENVSSVCFEAEQIILHGEHAVSDLARLSQRFLNHSTNSPQTIYYKLRGLQRPTVLIGQPSSRKLPRKHYSYLPLAFGASHASKSASQEESLRWSHRLDLHSSFERPSRPVLAFFSTWAYNAGETWVRVLPFLHEIASRIDGGKLHRLIPAMVPDGLRPLFEPFTDSLEPLALWPFDADASNGTKAITWLSDRLFTMRGTPTQLREHQQRSAAMFARRQPNRCFTSALVCDLYSDMDPMHLRTARRAVRPWATMQAIVSHHGLQHPDAGAYRLRACEGRVSPACPLKVAFEYRTRRRILNMDELIHECNRWGQAAAVVVECSARSFYNGLVAGSSLGDVDVLVSPHGAGMINSLQMHAGSSVVEVVPVHRAGCPCDSLPNLLSMEPRIRHYQLSTNNVSYAKGKRPGFHNDLL